MYFRVGWFALKIQKFRWYLKIKIKLNQNAPNPLSRSTKFDTPATQLSGARRTAETRERNSWYGALFRTDNNKTETSGQGNVRVNHNKEFTAIGSIKLFTKLRIVCENRKLSPSREED